MEDARGKDVSLRDCAGHWIVHIVRPRLAAPQITDWHDRIIMSSLESGQISVDGQIGPKGTDIRNATSSCALSYALLPSPETSARSRMSGMQMGIARREQLGSCEERSGASAIESDSCRLLFPPAAFPLLIIYHGHTTILLRTYSIPAPPNVV